MRTLQRNKRPICYALYNGVTEAVDNDGNYTGEQVVTYGNPVKTKMNVSGARGKAEIEMFGVENPFTHTLITDDLETPFDTQTIWWVNTSPVSAVAGIAVAGIAVCGMAHSQPHDFRCTGVARTNNTVTIALAEVDVSHGQENNQD